MDQNDKNKAPSAKKKLTSKTLDKEKPDFFSFKFNFRTTALLIIGIILCYIAYIISFFVYRIDFSVPIDRTGFGTFGDYIGGVLNPLLAFLSFVALTYTLKLQNDQLQRSDLQLDLSRNELELSRHELELTREELAKSANAQVDAKKVMDEQLKTQSLQQFDSLFFSMLGELNKILSDLDQGSGKTSILDHCHNIATRETNVSLEAPTQTILKNKYISRYFIYLYQLLKIIDERIELNNYINADERAKLKKMYSNIVRASISEKAMQLLMVNGLSTGFNNYKRLLENLSFFEHVSFQTHPKHLYSLTLLHSALSYDEKAFDQSTYYKELIQSNIYSKYIYKNKIFSITDFYKKIFTDIDLNNELDKKIETDSNSRIINKYFYCQLSLNKSIHKNIKIQLNDHYNPIVWFILSSNTKNVIEEKYCKSELKNSELSITTQSGDELLVISFDQNGQYAYTPPDQRYLV